MCMNVVRFLWGKLHNVHMDRKRQTVLYYVPKYVISQSHASILQLFLQFDNYS